MSKELQAAVAALIDPTRVRLFRDDEAKGTWHDLPSIWWQLVDSAQTGSGEGGAARFGSRPVISTPVVALIITVTDAAVGGVLATVGESRGNVPDNLRAIAANLTDAELIGLWTERVRRWTTEARGRLQLDAQRPRAVRGVRCPKCGESTAYIDDQGGERDATKVRTPALLITWVGPEDDSAYHEDFEWKVRAVECRACTAVWFRGGALDVLIGQMLAANTSRETMADIADA